MPLTLHRGRVPLLVSLPHDGSEIPDDIAARMTPDARCAPDTDWHVARLYAFVRDMGASMLVPRYSRYVVDLNRPPDDVSLYPGQVTTGLCPRVQFNGSDIYRAGQMPSADEIAARLDTYWRPYHAALRDELDRLRALHGRVLLWEGHSIRGAGLPLLFEGRLPDLNLGTVDGTSCDPRVQAGIEATLAAQGDYDFVVNGRFKGGYITRHYGNPARGIDAVQLEISQRTYMDQDTYAYNAQRASDVQPLIRALIEAALAATRVSTRESGDNV